MVFAPLIAVAGMTGTAAAADTPTSGGGGGGAGQVAEPQPSGGTPNAPATSARLAAAPAPPAAGEIGGLEDCTGAASRCAPLGLTSVVFTKTGDLTACRFDATISWGDGTPVIAVPDFQQGQTVTHQYTAPGIYTVDVPVTATQLKPPLTCTPHPNSWTVEAPRLNMAPTAPLPRSPAADFATDFPLITTPLAWKASTDPEGGQVSYQVQFSTAWTDAEFTNSLHRFVATGWTTATVGELPQTLYAFRGERWRWRVVAKDPLGKQTVGPTRTIITGDMNRPYRGAVNVGLPTHKFGGGYHVWPSEGAEDGTFGVIVNDIAGRRFAVTAAHVVAGTPANGDLFTAVDKDNSRPADFYLRVGTERTLAPAQDLAYTEIAADEGRSGYLATVSDGGAFNFERIVGVADTQTLAGYDKKLPVYISGTTTTLTAGTIKNLATADGLIETKMDGKVAGGTSGSALYTRLPGESGVRVIGIVVQSDLAKKSRVLSIPIATTLVALSQDWGRQIMVSTAP